MTTPNNGSSSHDVAADTADNNTTSSADASKNAVVDQPPQVKEESNTRIHALEIDLEDLRTDNEQDDDMNDNPNDYGANHDLEGLLSESSHHDILQPTSSSCCLCFTPPVRVGNMRILCPRLWYHTSWGIMGPHWFGPLCVLGIIVASSAHFIHRSWNLVGPLTAGTCTMFALMTSYHLINTSYRDPGVVLLIQRRRQQKQPGTPDAQNENTARQRWCDVCQAFQPPDGAHCPECNVCIAGYDHHCVWMGICIGRNNLKQFVRFNLSWLMYLTYALLWVSLVGPLISGRGGKKGNTKVDPASLLKKGQTTSVLPDGQAASSQLDDYYPPSVLGSNESTSGGGLSMNETIAMNTTFVNASDFGIINGNSSDFETTIPTSAAQADVQSSDTDHEHQKGSSASVGEPNNDTTSSPPLT